jgi:hypothetical protein
MTLHILLLPYANWPLETQQNKSRVSCTYHTKYLICWANAIHQIPGLHCQLEINKLSVLKLLYMKILLESSEVKQLNFQTSGI